MPSVRLGIGLGLPTNNANAFWSQIDRCEAEGIDSVWLSDRLIGASAGLEPMVALSAIAGRTRKLKLGPSVLVLPQRQPVVVAKEAATLDFLSNGRLLMAVGVGVDDPRDWIASGIRKEERGARIDEAIPLLRKLWSGESTTHHGRFYHVDDAIIAPQPRQQQIPIWLGGRSEAALRRTVRLGDGWIPSFISVDEFADAKKRIHALEVEYDRELESDHYGAYITYCVAETREKAQDIASNHLMVPRSRPNAPAGADYVAIGTVDDVAERIRRYIEVGASKFIMRPICPPDQVEDQIHWLGARLAPMVETTTASKT